MWSHPNSNKLLKASSMRPSLHLTPGTFNSKSTVNISLMFGQILIHKGQVIRATILFNLSRNVVTLQVEKRCCLYHHLRAQLVTQNNFIVASCGNMLHKVDTNSTFSTIFSTCSTQFSTELIFGGNIQQRFSTFTVSWSAISSCLLSPL